MMAMAMPPISFVTGDVVLIAAAGVAALGAVIAGVLALRGRGRSSEADDLVRRAPSPSSVGLADDPIVAAIGVDERRARRVRHADRIDPPL